MKGAFLRKKRGEEGGEKGERERKCDREKLGKKERSGLLLRSDIEG
jgi:hypothetical protein